MMEKLKTVYLGNRNYKFRYKTPKEVQEEAKRYWIAIGDNVTLGQVAIQKLEQLQP